MDRRQDMSTNATEHARDWDAQRERLSAYLDGQLTPADLSALERHISTCARCTDELAELRRLVALLHAMPAPQLPRAFTLPETGSRGMGGRTGRWTAVAAVTQWAGGVAAAAGVVLLLGAALAGLTGHGTATSIGYMPALSRAPSSTAAGSNADRTQPAPTGSGSYGAVASGTPGHVARQATAEPTSTAAPQGTQPGRYAGYPENGPSSPVELPVVGGGLFAAGAVVFIVARRARRRSG